MTDNEATKRLDYKITYDGKGREKSRSIKQTIRNFEIILEYDRRFCEKIKYNEFVQRDYAKGDLPWQPDNDRPWSNYDDSALFSIIQSEYELKSRSDYFDAVKNVSMKNKYHPVRELLDTLEWNGKECIRGLLPNYLGALDTEYNYEVMKLFMVGAVARVYEPGCKFDYCPIFTGPQGLGKSTFLCRMAIKSEWFNDNLGDLDSKDTTDSIMGSWIIELAELKSIAKTSGGIESVKRFITATQDKVRLAYERRADIYLRQCVFSGTTNKTQFLQDETGNRRFLIIETGINKPTKDVFGSEISEDIMAAWAQAVHIWKTEKSPLVLPDSCKEEALQLQQGSMSDDGTRGIIEAYLEDKQRTCAIEIWQKALGEQGSPPKWRSSEIIDIILSFPGWEKMKSPGRFGEYGQQRGLKKCQQRCLQSTPQECLQTDNKVVKFEPINKNEQIELPFD